MNVLWIRKVRAKRMKFIAESFDTFPIKRTGRDCEVVTTLTKTGTQCKHWMQVAKRAPRGDYDAHSDYANTTMSGNCEL